MENVAASNIAVLRMAMEENKYDWFFCSTDDYHASEYVADYFKVREYYTGFTGENAFLLLNASNAYMWTDGRFFIQADIQLSGSGVSLMKMGEPGVPTIYEYIKDNVKAGETLFFDGRMVSSLMGKKIEKILSDNGASLVFNESLAGDLWEQRPKLPSSKVFILPMEVVGESTEKKLERIREKMDVCDADAHFIGSLDDIAWITNMRANDVECNPVFLSYMYITKDDAKIFMQKSEVTSEVTKYLSDAGIKVLDYDEVLNFLQKSELGKRVLIDESSVNYSCCNIISNKCEAVYAINPSKPMKAVKNSTEIEKLKDAYLLDSVCVTKFIYWLKTNVGRIDISEISAAEHIDNLRKEVPGFIELSFPTISGYGSNGAIIHYGVTKESNKTVKPEGMLLVDSGGTYLNGTTDVTRTISCGPVSDKMKLYYTKTAIGMINLANARFLSGCTGRNLDIICRQPLWNIGYDYKHGTGHGVGHILNVHEGPQSIRWQYVDGAKEYALVPGMVTSDEPGVYIKDEFGIRIENIILCVDDVTNESGNFLKFEHLTFAPLDRDLLDKNILNSAEIDAINAYQELVYEKMKGHLNEEEDKWLRKETLPL